MSEDSDNDHTALQPKWKWWLSADSVAHVPFATNSSCECPAKKKKDTGGLICDIKEQPGVLEPIQMYSCSSQRMVPHDRTVSVFRDRKLPGRDKTGLQVTSALTWKKQRN